MTEEKNLSNEIYLRILTNPTIKAKEIAVNYEVHENTARNHIAKVQEEFSSKKFQRESRLKEFLIFISLSKNDEVDENTIPKFLESVDAKRKYCTHHFDSFDKTCSCLYIVDNIPSYGEIIIVQADYLLNTHRIMLRIVLNTSQVGKLVPLISRNIKGEISVESAELLH